MPIAHSKLTAQGKTSVPEQVRKKLGLRSGSVMEWDESGGEVTVRRAGQYTSARVHEALFGAARARKAKVVTKEGIRRYVRQRHVPD
jgi:bifunctional DNA-binding transcriptional regulator/antitoxin component of YhaV-PrlF toxin-antitoxin module